MWLNFYFKSGRDLIAVVRESNRLARIKVESDYRTSRDSL